MANRKRNGKKSKAKRSSAESEDENGGRSSESSRKMKKSRKKSGISKDSLRGRPSQRIAQLAKITRPDIDNNCREFPIKISRAALRYKASKRIIEISKPNEFPISDECKSLMEMTRGSKSRKPISRKDRAILTRKALRCPELLTDQEIRILMTPGGIYRSALTYKFTPWMEYLSLPPYRFLKDREDETATNWKAYILEENETRGRKALEEQTKREQKKTEREEAQAEKAKRDGGAEGNRKPDENERKPENEGEENGEETSGLDEDKKDEETTESAEERKPEVKAKNEDSKASEEKSAAENREENDPAKEEELAKKKAERNAWRFLPSPCKKGDPFAIKRAALKGKVSPRVAELAVRKRPKAVTCRKNPFIVRKSALNGPIPERIPVLAKPRDPRDPIEKPPPREKDEFGRPIYPKPPYGRKLPRVKRSDPAKCPDEEKKDGDGKDEEDAKKDRRKERKRRFIDPIVYEATIDPCFEPERSKRQIKAREAAKQEFARRNEEKKKKRDKMTKDNGTDETEENKNKKRKGKKKPPDTGDREELRR